MPRNMTFSPKPLAFAIVLLTLMTASATMMLSDDRGPVLTARIQASYTSSFNLTVIDEDGRPIGGLSVGPATVKIVGNTTMPAGWQTDVNGSAMITGVSGNSTGILYYLSVNATGFQTALKEVVAKENRTTNVTIILVGGVILGKVSTAAMPPVGIAGATVYIPSLGSGYSNKTNSLGQYIMKGIPEGRTYKVWANASGYIAVPKDVSVPITGSADFVLMSPTGSISGFVYDSATHNGLSGTSVSLSINNSAILIPVTSSANGSYHFTGVPPGIYNVTATKIGFSPNTTTGVEVTRENQTTLDFNLTEIPTLLHGTVRSGTLLLVRANISVVGTKFYNLTGPDGTYAINGVPPGTYAITATRTGFYSNTTTGVEVTRENQTTLDFNLTEKPTLLHGTVRSGTLLLVRANISVVGTRFYSLSGPDGTYEITNITAGTYTVQASRLGYVTALFEEVIGHGEEKELNVNLTAIPGAILRGVVSAIVGNVRTLLVDVKVTLVTTNITQNSTSTNILGEFAFTGLAPGNYTVLFELANYRPMQVSGITVTNGTTPTHQFSMTPLRHGFSGFIFGFDMPHSMMILGLFLTIAILAIAVYLRIRHFQAPGSAPAVYDEVDDEKAYGESADGQGDLEDRLSESKGKG